MVRLFSTPLGDIEIRIDGRLAHFNGCSIKKDGTCADVAGRYALCVDFKPDGLSHSITCKILGHIVDEKDEIETGEWLELKSFYKDNIKLSIGMEGDVGYIGNERVSEYDYDNDYFDDGVSYEILPETKTEIFVFGISWIEGIDTPERDCQTWYGADVKGLKCHSPEEVYCPISTRMIKDISCIETRDAVDGNITSKYMHNGFFDTEENRAYCKKCRWHDY